MIGSAAHARNVIAPDVDTFAVRLRLLSTHIRSADAISFLPHSAYQLQGRVQLQSLQKISHWRNSWPAYLQSNHR